MTTKHTPGPWYTKETATHIDVVSIDGEVLFHDDKRTPKVIEDACLIAAAPELLEFALEYLRAWENGMAGDGYLHDIAKSAIAKAMGTKHD